MNYELKLGDTLERMKEIPDGSVDMVMCDLPYGTTACKWDSVIPFEPLWEAYRRVCKKNAAIVLTASQPFTSALVMSNVKGFRYSWVWVKNKPVGHLNAKKRPMPGTEDVLVFCEGIENYNPQGLKESGVMVKRKGCSSGPYRDCAENTIQTHTGYPRNDIRFAHDQSVGHPTQKPVALMEYLIKTYTDPGELVLDNTMGSGTTGVACMNTRRNFIGIERDENYFAICNERIGKAFLENYEI